MLAIAIDNCVISHYIADRLPPDLMKEKEAFEEMISLHEQKVIEIGWPFTTGLIENAMKNCESRSKVEVLLRDKGIPKIWPVLDSTPQETQQQAICLKKIIGDTNGFDSKQLVIIAKVTQARYFVTTDYKFHRQFNRHKEDIKKRCKIGIFVMTPSEFMIAYKNSKI